ncbi:hypothetical protein HRbin01_00040 [archaeon HR01]|nr:hypothetical protein HRbin01_00040 [archaeon HR01]
MYRLLEERYIFGHDFPQSKAAAVLLIYLLTILSERTKNAPHEIELTIMLKNTPPDVEM